MYYLIFGLLGAALLGTDQWVKAWVVGHLQLGETTSLFPGFLELMRVHNYGAAWSSFSGARWLLIALTAAGRSGCCWVSPASFWRRYCGCWPEGSSGTRWGSAPAA